MSKLTKNIIIISGVLITLIIVAVVYSFVYIPSQVDIASRPITATGAVENDVLDQSIVVSSQNLAAAKKLVPYQSSDFSVEYLSSKILFVVTLPNSDVTAGETKLSDWLKSQGVDYSTISDYFKFIVN